VLTNLTHAISDAGNPPAGALGLLGGVRETWAGRQVFSAPNLRSLVQRTTQMRINLHIGKTTLPGVVIRRSGELAPLFTSSHHLPEIVIAWVMARPDLRMRNVPGALLRVLEEEGLSLDIMDPAERRHATSLVQEAATSEIRDARIQSILDILSTRKGEKIV
jgi:hypothetical protein